MESQNPTDWVLAGILATVLVAVIRAAINQTWVPGKFYHDMRAERDAAIAEARIASKGQFEMIEQQSEMLRHLSERVGELHTRVGSLTPCKLPSEEEQVR